MEPFPAHLYAAEAGFRCSSKALWAANRNGFRSVQYRCLRIPKFFDPWTDVPAGTADTPVVIPFPATWAEPTEIEETVFMKTPELQQSRNANRTSTRRITSMFLSLVGILGVALASRAMYAAPSNWQVPFQYPAPLGVGTGTNVQSVPISLQTGGTIATVTVVTQGAVGEDFTAVASGTCVPGQTFSTGGGCTASVQFLPKAPGRRQGAVVLLDANGSVLGTTLLYGIGVGPVGVFVPATIKTVAGNGAWVFRNDGGLAIDSPIFLPGGMAADGAGNVFISDSSNNRIRRVDISSGVIVTVAGTGSPGSGGDNGIATSASVNTPTGMVIDGAGNVIFADSANHAVRKLTLATGILSTIAGQLGQQGYTGDGGQAFSALLNTPESVAFDGKGDLLISDTGNHVIRRIDAATGAISTIAGTGRAGFSGDGGTGTAAALNTPWGIANRCEREPLYSRPFKPANPKAEHSGHDNHSSRNRDRGVQRRWRTRDFGKRERSGGHRR